MQNHFELFHLPQQFAVDLKALDQAYRDVQNQVHPDKFARSPDAEKRVAMQWATRANEAYQTLKSPLRRATYLCELHGVDGELAVLRMIQEARDNVWARARVGVGPAQRARSAWLADRCHHAHEGEVEAWQRDLGARLQQHVAAVRGAAGPGAAARGATARGATAIAQHCLN